MSLDLLVFSFLLFCLVNFLICDVDINCQWLLCSYSVGYAFAYGGSDYDNPNKTFIGSSDFFLVDVEDLTFWLFQFAFAATR